MKAITIIAALALTGCATLETPIEVQHNYAKFAQTFDVMLIPNEGDRAIVALAITDMNTLLEALSGKAPVDIESMRVHIARAASSLRNAQQVYLKYRSTLTADQIVEYDTLSVQLSTILVEFETKQVTNSQRFEQAAQLLSVVVKGLYN